MTYSGDVAEQVVRMSLEGAEVVLKIAGAGAKEIATFLYAALQNKKNTPSLKTKGKERLTKMIKSGKELKVFAVKESDLKEFSNQAKRYGVTYCALRDKKGSPDGLCDIMVTAEDAPKINRIIERFDFDKLDKAKIQSEIEKSKSEKNADNPAPDKAAQQKNDAQKVLENILKKPGQGEKQSPENPAAAKTTEPRPSEPIYTSNSKSAKGTSDGRQSTRQELREIVQSRKNETDMPKHNEKQPDSKKSIQKNNKHKRLPKKIKIKNKDKVR